MAKVINPADGFNKKISSMFAASAEERYRDEPGPACLKGSSRSKVPKKRPGLLENLHQLCASSLLQCWCPDVSPAVHGSSNVSFESIRIKDLHP